MKSDIFFFRIVRNNYIVFILTKIKVIKYQKMSFVQRLCKANGKVSYNRGSTKVKTENIEKIERQQQIKQNDNEFHQNHCDLKSILKLLEGDNNSRQDDLKFHNQSSQQLKSRPKSKAKGAMQCTKQNTRNKIRFMKTPIISPEKKNKLRIRKNSQDQDKSEFQKYSLLLNNLKMNTNPRAEKTDWYGNNPQTVQEKPRTPTKIDNNSTQKRGLQNIGNTCYMNAVLQCLFHLGSFSDDLRLALNSSADNRKIVVNKYLDLFEGVIRKNNQYKDLSTLPLKTSVSKICSMFINFQQQDAHQFLRQLLNTMHQQINRVQYSPQYKKFALNSNDQNLPGLVQQYRKFYKRYDDSYIYDAFCGQFCSFVKCSNCQKQSSVLQNFLDISLPLLKGINTVEQLLQGYFSEESLSDYYFCQSCTKSNKYSIKKLDLWNPPNYLLIHLKRSQFGKKNDDRIKIPMRNLNMKRFMKSRNDKLQKSGVYRLQGVVQHLGAVDGGHYWSLVRDSNSWYNVDDAIVTPRTHQNVTEQLETNGSSTAYILFYQLI